MTFRIDQIDFFRIDMHTRFPFRYGIASMTDVPHLIVQVVAEIDGQQCTGIAAEGLPPKWFTKHPTTTFEQDDLPSMLQSIRSAADHALATPRQHTLFDWWWQIYQAQREWSGSQRVPSLLAGLGCSLMERAAIDAFCRFTRLPFATALRRNTFGIDLGRMRHELSGSQPADVLPTFPRQSLHVRHTVGLGDPLTDGEISAEAVVSDGLPHSLVESIRRYGLRYFKIKLSGEVTYDCERMTALQQVLDREAGSSLRFTLDGNEQYLSFSDFQQAWQQLRAIGPVAKMLDQHLLFVEQPLHRDVALAEGVGEQLRRWADAPPMIIDESDCELDSFPRAMSLGYRGTSHKNCKGIFKSLANAATIQRERAAGRSLILSAEDLGNVGPVALLQDLAVVASLGIDHVERNGHHYFAGLGMFPNDIQQAVLHHHGDLYQQHPGGFAALAVHGGQIELASVLRAPFGLEPLPNWSSLDRWNF